MLRTLDVPNGVTLLGLMLSLLSVTQAAQGHFQWALICLMYAGIADLFDGFLARRMRRREVSKQVGRALDSLVDACSFGFAPAVLAWCFGLRNGSGQLILAGYAGAALLRLAWFDTHGLTEEGRYLGLPVTYSALVIPLAFVVCPSQAVMRWTYGLLAAAMVSSVPIPKPRGAAYVVFPLLAVVLTVMLLW